MFADTWINEGDEVLSTKAWKELLMWLSISWVFRDATTFNDVTELIIRTNNKPDYPLNVALGDLDEDVLVPQPVLGTSVKRFFIYYITNAYLDAI